LGLRSAGDEEEATWLVPAAEVLAPVQWEGERERECDICSSNKLADKLITK
jgi:hypothetical protein